jgi:hypothetical protein
MGLVCVAVRPAQQRGPPGCRNVKDNRSAAHVGCGGLFGRPHLPVRASWLQTPSLPRTTLILYCGRRNSVMIQPSLVACATKGMRPANRSCLKATTPSARSAVDSQLHAYHQLPTVPVFGSSSTSDT